MAAPQSTCRTLYQGGELNPRMRSTLHTAGNVPLECLDGPSTSEVQPYHYLICQSAPTPWVLAQRKALGG